MKRLVAGAVALGLIALSGCGATSAPTSSAKPAAASSSSSSSKSATAASGSSSSSTAAKPLTPVTLLLDWLVEGYQSPFYLGIQKGFFKQAGIDLKILPGKGSISTTEQIGHNNYQFGFADAESVATAIDKNVPVKIVGDFLQVSPVAIIVLNKSGITKPSDLIGKTIGSAPGSSSYNLLPAFLSANHLSSSQVKVQTMGNESLLGALKAGKVQGITEYDIDTLPQLQVEGLAASDLPFASWGVPGLSLGITVNTSYLASHKSLVQAFVRASQKSFVYAATHEAQSIAAEKQIAGTTPPGAIGMLKLLFANSSTANSKGHPFGWMSKTDWNNTLSVVNKYFGGKSKALSDYYTNQFVDGGPSLG